MTEPTAEHYEAAGELLGRNEEFSSADKIGAQSFEKLLLSTAQFLAYREAKSGWNYDMSEAPGHNGDPHMRGITVYNNRTGVTRFDAYYGYISEDTGNFIDQYGEDFGWRAEDFEAFKLIDLPEVKS